MKWVNLVAKGSFSQFQLSTTKHTHEVNLAELNKAKVRVFRTQAGTKPTFNLLPSLLCINFDWANIPA